MSIRADLIERARATDILDVAQRAGATLKRAGGEHIGPCPVCGGRDRFAINLKKRGGVFNCRGCGASGDVIALLQHIDGCSFSEAIERLTEGRRRPSAVAVLKAIPQASESDARNLEIAAKIVSDLRPLIGSPGEAYLRDVRRIDVGAIEDVLERVDAIGWHSAVYFNEPGHALHGRKLGAIVGIMTDAKTAQPTGAISRTYVAPDLTKIGKAKTLGSPAGIVRLSPDDEVLGGLFLAEGLETALAGMAIGLRPMWSTGSTGLISSFPTLSGVEALNIVVDNDDNGAGEKAARQLEARWLLAAGKEVHLLRPDAPAISMTA